jgi:hypothetical protein
VARRQSPFARAEPRFKPQPRLLVLCEDSKSSLTYLIDAAVHWRVKQHIAIEHCGKTDPLGIVNEAIGRRGKFDEVVCVIDRDAHVNFEEACQAAARHLPSLSVYPSYPCFEYWLLLHFEFTRRPYRAAGALSAGDQLVRDLRKRTEMAQYAKGTAQGLFDQLLPLLANADQNARNALASAQQENEPNPSTRMHLVLERFQGLATPQLITQSE